MTKHLIPSLDEGLARYFREISQYPSLTVEQEKTADRKTLITSNLKLAVHIAKNYIRSWDDLPDKIQDANIGLVVAAGKFEPHRGKFSICASFYIRAEIRNKALDRKKKKSGMMEISLDDRSSDLDGMTTEGRYNLEADILASESNMLHDDNTDFITTAAMDRLTNKQKQVIAGRLWGYTYEEIGEIMGCSQQNIRQLEQNAIKRIRGEG
jgi:RNA polymerase sigma factor (sigma-70 family)